MMMASSTTIPSTNMNANRLMMLMVTPTNGTGINMKAPRNATAIPRITHSAIFRCRNTPRITNTNIAPRAMFFSIMVMRPSRNTEVSAQTVIFASGGNVALRWST